MRRTGLVMRMWMRGSAGWLTRVYSELTSVTWLTAGTRLTEVMRLTAVTWLTTANMRCRPAGRAPSPGQEALLRSRPRREHNGPMVDLSAGRSSRGRAGQEG